MALPLLAVGLAAFFLDALRSEKGSFESFFKGFTEYLGTKLLSMLLMQIFISLWSILLFIPGIVKSYSYSMTPYILLDKPELSATEAITDSRMMMRGHKWQLFLLDLSFIGWILLSLLTFGILFIYVIPYMEAARAEFYRTLKGENEPKVAEDVAIEIPQ